MADGPQRVIYLSFMLSLAATSAQFVDMSSHRHLQTLRPLSYNVKSSCNMTA